MDRRESVKRVALMMGGALSATTLSFVMDGCTAKEKKAETAVGLFSSDEHALISELAEAIIPTTDTPGAKDAKVPEFISMMMEECYPEDFQQHFKQGLDGLEQQSQQQYKKSFAKLEEDDRNKLLKSVEEAAFKPGAKSPGAKPHYYRTFKELTMLGFFSSEPGATKTLEYVPIPGRFDGCIDLKPGQKTWAT